MKKKKRKNNIRYSRLVILGSLLLFCVMIGRVIQLGLSKKIDGIDLATLASKRTTRTDVITALRGNIYSSNGDVYHTLISYLHLQILYIIIITQSLFFCNLLYLSK